MERTFEYDIAKSLINYSKHDIDFEDAKALFDDPDLVEARVADTYKYGEVRWQCLGKIGKVLWEAIITYRGRNTRIMSVREPNKKGRDLYERKH